MAADDSSRDTRPSLLQRVRDPGDREAWNQFVDLYAPLIYAYLRRRGLQDADAADVGQEVLAQVARSIRGFQYQPERGRFRDWLGAVTRSKLSRFHQRQNRLAQLKNGEPDEAADLVAEAVPESEWTAEFNAHLLQVALDRVCPSFEPASWQAFTRTWIDGLSAADAAHALNMPVDAVYVARSRVLKRLREEVLVLAEDLPQLVPLR